MVEQKLITPATVPTEWCSPNMIVLKVNGQIRNCADLTDLNKRVMREYKTIRMH